VPWEDVINADESAFLLHAARAYRRGAEGVQIPIYGNEKLTYGVTVAVMAGACSAYGISGRTWGGVHVVGARGGYHVRTRKSCVDPKMVCGSENGVRIRGHVHVIPPEVMWDNAIL
jgi:hypothetical protein